MRTKKPVPFGNVIVRVVSGKGLKARMDDQSARLQAGSFVVKLKSRGERVKAFYIPAAGFGNSEYDEKEMR